ncbi:hypothetical protein PR048_011524 [Dryococelus australis]|uniref:Uncharacterized protein n=1 Tax=Dryococelus australis TaxID=614101 RepID=A0ABQ9HLY0_9NEOP|nr:hypothetical protein PR048_011524 [Dryococelus australis]
MKCLKNVFERKSILSIFYVRRQLLSLNCKMGTDLEEHFQQFDRLIWDLEETGNKMDKSDKVCHLLLTMRSSYNTIVTVFETITDTLTKCVLLLSLCTEVNSCETGKINFIVDSGATEHLVQKSLQEHMIQVELLKSPITIKVANGSHVTSNSRVDALIVEGLSHNLFKFTSHIKLSENIGDLIHCDVCGPINPPTK